MLVFLNGSYDLARIFAYILALIICFGCHEWAHAFVAYKQGDYTPKGLGRLTINPLAHLDILGTICLVLFGFGWAKPVPINPLNFKDYKKGNILVSIAGVAINFIIAIFAAFLLFLFTRFVDYFSILALQFIFYLLFYIVSISLSLALFNLIPIPPLDGHKLLKAVVGSGNKFVSFIEKYSMILLIIAIPIYDMLVNILIIPLLQLII